MTGNTFIYYPKPLSEDPQVGQVWRWHADRDGFMWDELWLLLSNDFPNKCAFEALQLESGEINSVFPAMNRDDLWERVA